MDKWKLPEKGTRKWWGMVAVIIAFIVVMLIIYVIKPVIGN